MARSLLALGSNLGDRQTMLERACAELARLPETKLLARSSWHGTIPIGGTTDQGEFLNGAVMVGPNLSPQQLATQLLGIESQLGRERVVRWDARTIDIDLLLYDQETIESPDLIVPHPRMSFRKFVLQPAAEIAGWMLHPSSGWTLAGLLSHLQHASRHVVVTAADQSLANWLVTKLCETMDCTAMGESAEKNSREDAASLDSRIEFPDPICGKPPALEIQSLGSHRDCCDSNFPPAALTIFLDAEDWSLDHRKKFNSLSLGPVARITTNDSAKIMQEAQAALRSIWPDLES